MTVRPPVQTVNPRRRNTVEFLVIVRRGPLVDHEWFYDRERADAFVDRLRDEGATVIPTQGANA